MSFHLDFYETLKNPSIYNVYYIVIILHYIYLLYY